MVIEKHFLKHISETGLEDTLFNISLVNIGIDYRCVIYNLDDWELSYTGEDAEYKFMLLLEDTDLRLGDILKLGFKQYG